MLLTSNQLPNIKQLTVMIKENKLHLIRPEDVLALLMILPSIWVTSPSEYYYLFNGNLIISKHTTALMVLILFAVFTALYENRIQRIIDTMKSGVKIPAVTIQDQSVYLWKRKFRILQVIRDYLPFLVCFMAFHRLTVLIPHVKGYDVDRIFMSFDRFAIEGIRLKILGWFGSSREFKDLISISYKTYLLGVPIIATYLYMVKELKQFRQFLLTISIGLILALLINMLFPSMGLESIIRGIKAPLTGSVSLPAIYTTAVLLFSIKFSKALSTFYIPIAILFFIAEILSYSNYLLTILISVIVGLIAIPLAKLIQGAWN
ncbi:MAG: hypothetical protein WCQ53_04590 [bacterium]